MKLSPPSRPAGGRALAMSCCYCPAVMSSPLPTSSSWSLALLTVQGFNWIVISTAPLSLDRGPASLPNAGRKHIYVHVTSSPLYKVAWATHAPHLRRGWVRRQGNFSQAPRGTSEKPPPETSSQFTCPRAPPLETSSQPGRRRSRLPRNSGARGRRRSRLPRNQSAAARDFLASQVPESAAARDFLAPKRRRPLPKN